MASKATAIFDGDDSRLAAVVERIDRRLRDLQGGFARTMGAVKAILGSALIAKAGEQFAAALDVGGNLNDLAANTGIAVDQMLILQQEFRNSGKAAEDVAPAINKMQKALQEGTANAEIARLGLELDTLRQLTPVEQFRALGAAIDGLQDPAEKTAVAMALFGKQGASLLSTFASKGFGDAAEQVGSQAEILSRNAGLFDAVSDKLALAGLKTQAFFVGAAERIAPVLLPLLDGFAKLDLAKLGQQVGEVIAVLIQSFSDGSIWEALLTTGQIALAELGNFLAGVFDALGQGIWQYLVEGANNAVAVLQTLVTPSFWVGLAESLLAAASRFNALMLEGVANLIDYLASAPGLGFLRSGATAARDNAAQQRTAAGELDRRASQSLAPTVDLANQRLQATIGNTVAAITRGFREGQTLFDTKALNDRLADQFAAAMEKVNQTSVAQLAANPTVSGAPGGTVSGELTPRGVSSLQRIALGGYGADPLLDENKRHTALLASIDRTVRNQKPQTVVAPLVFI